MSQENEESLQGSMKLGDLQQAITKIVWKNDSLRDELAKNPRGVIERELGVKFGDDIKFNVIDQANPNVITFVLPYHPKDTTGVEFTDKQLDAIAGGLFVNNQDSPFTVFTAPAVDELTIISHPVTEVHK